MGPQHLLYEGGHDLVKRSFPHLDRYSGIRLGVALEDVGPGEIRVVESSRRLAAEQSYGYVHGLWGLELTDGRAVVSVPPGAGDAVQAVLDDWDDEGSLCDDRFAETLRGPVDQALLQAGLPATDRVLRDLVFACNGALVRRYSHPACRRLVDASIPPAEGLGLPIHCFPEGVVYGVVGDQQVVAVAFAHRAGVMEEEVADIGVETAPCHRRRGYAQAAVSALVAHFTDRGGEARYGCSPSNQASRATARSVGFVSYAQSLILSAPRNPKEVWR